MEGEFPPAQPVSLPDSGTVEVGRSGEADVILPPLTVSGRHALVKVGESLVLRTPFTIQREGSSTACSVEQGADPLGRPCQQQAGRGTDPFLLDDALLSCRSRGAGDGDGPRQHQRDVHRDGVELDSMVNYPLEFGSEVVFGEDGGASSRIRLASVLCQVNQLLVVL